MPHRSCTALVAILLALAGSSAAAQRPASPPIRTVAAPETEFPEAFSSVVGLRELSDGRVIVSDNLEKRVHLLDFRTGRAVEIGREGSGPGEFVSPGILLRAAGDTTLLVDLRSNRFLVISPAGIPTRTIPLTDAGASPFDRVTIRAIDPLGRQYAEESSLRMPTAAGLQFPESLAVLRIDPTRNRTDTLGYTRQPKMSMEIGGTPSAPQPRLRMVHFAPRDAWTVGADGSVAIVRGSNYSVDWVIPGASSAAPPVRVAGPQIPYERQRITEADKKQFTEQMERALDRASAGRGAPPGMDPRQMFAQMEWAEFKPPFVDQPQIAPDGRLWVPRTPNSPSALVTFDVIDRGGRVVERVTFPPRTALIAFGTRYMYTLRVDDDDLIYVQRRPL